MSQDGGIYLQPEWGQEYNLCRVEPMCIAVSMVMDNACYFEPLISLGCELSCFENHRMGIRDVLTGSEMFLGGSEMFWGGD